ncbi:hypothetical protein CCACVL1_20221 [Corchorus capsularis]|uniref:Uncharacterized protein n=1 Tax=Corchorus capsularis TaxID=210143 RepID=A0A1R3HC38_COCAP|nr:hypothetical protein CCACVL1_20221 [Corchorus capsularis]
MDPEMDAFMKATAVAGRPA